MIEIIISDEFFRYDAYHITKAFYPNVEVIVELKEYNSNTLNFYKNEELLFSVYDGVNELVASVNDRGIRKIIKHFMNQALYRNLVEYTGRNLEWGFMTGIRPTKITMKKWHEFKQNNEEESNIDSMTKEWLEDYYNVSCVKSALAVQVVKEENQLLECADLEDGYSLYIGIPFCKTRCSYCSFTAYPLDKWVDRMDEYLDNLCDELIYIANKSKNKTLDAIYIGGGTPTSLEADQLDRLFKVLKGYFPYSKVKEITVEAGRPDTITYEKLLVMKNNGVDRISINPQTMNEETLKKVGRSHSVEEVRLIFKEAREVGFDNINMDIILGLPGETTEDVRNTLEQIKVLGPDSLTVHSLAMKRASKMNINSENIEESDIIGDMVNMSSEYAQEMGLKPYYLYRQKSIAGNNENIGYAKEGKSCLYNVLIMEEKQSIVAAGAGSASKIILEKKQNNILRIENVKEVNEYIARIDEMKQRKGEWLWP